MSPHDLSIPHIDWRFTFTVSKEEESVVYLFHLKSERTAKYCETYEFLYSFFL
jgi:hypothetical protein